GFIANSSSMHCCAPSRILSWVSGKAHDGGLRSKAGGSIIEGSMDPPNAERSLRRNRSNWPRRSQSKQVDGQGFQETPATTSATIRSMFSCVKSSGGNWLHD